MPGALIDPIVNIPKLIEQGDCPSWIDQPFTDDQGTTYSAANYGLQYILAGATAPLTLTGVTTGVGWTTQISTTQSGGLSPGLYWWQAQLTAASFQLTVARGEIFVAVNLANAAANYSGLSQAEQQLAQWQNALAALTGSNGSSPVESYRIGTREMKYRNVDEILRAIAYWRAVVLSEQTANSIAQNRGNPRKLYVRFPSKFGTIA